MSKERLTDYIEKQKICDYIQGWINPYGKPFDGTVYEFGLKIVDYIKNSSCDEDAKELKQYRDLEEQGLLLRLPCKVGDTVYSFSFGEVFCAEIVEIKYICEAENYGKFIRQKITIDGEECGITIIDFSDIGKRYFLTQSEAEEKLRELEKNR